MPANEIEVSLVWHVPDRGKRAIGARCFEYCFRIGKSGLQVLPLKFISDQSGKQFVNKTDAGGVISTFFDYREAFAKAPERYVRDSKDVEYV